MREKISKSVREVGKSIIREMSIRASAYDNVISLGIGEPDFDTPEEVCNAALQDALKGFTHYTPSRGYEDLISALLDYIEASRGLRLNPEQLTITHGGMGALTAVLKAILDPGDEVILLEPHFPAYRAQVAFCGGRTVPVPTSFEDGFVVDPPRVEKVITSHTKALLINSPNNPTGSVIPTNVLDELARLAVENDLFVISDEVYDRLVFEGTHESIYTRSGMRERTVVINSFSKAFSMTGWRIGYCYGPEWLIDEVVKVATFFNSCPNSVGQRAALSALRMKQTVFDEMAAEYEARCQLVYERLEAMPGIKVHPSQGSFYLFPNVEEIMEDATRFALELLDREQVVVIPGEAFGSSGKGCVRISCTVNQAQLSEAMDRFERFVRSCS
ncbi:MAG: pyridoxal phosphate-dependent aminotransferase [Deltaproteobacteria bacterium]|nr:pyridoxal phosphate-dependent aminotransferase [Deltaproteobacteria bacterium]